MRKKICIALAIIWMGVIFYMSNQPASISSIHSGNTINIISKLPIIGNIMDYLTSINIGEFIVRKCAHMFSYCILAIQVSIGRQYKKSNNNCIFRYIFICM